MGVGDSLRVLQGLVAILVLIGLLSATHTSGIAGEVVTDQPSFWSIGTHTHRHTQIMFFHHSQITSGDLRGVAGGGGKLECLCGKAGASCVCDGSAHSSGCVVWAKA